MLIFLFQLHEGENLIADAVFVESGECHLRGLQVERCTR